MREIKAYIRPEKLDDVLHALYRAGVGHVTVTHVGSLGRPGVGIDPKHWELSVEAGARYTEMVKLEIVCAGPEVNRLLNLLREHGRTGQPGDGIVFVTPVDRAVKVRTGEEGSHTLR